MAVKNKFIHFNTRSGFNSQVPNPELNSENGNEFYNYIVFIKDSKEIYTHGQFYDCSKFDDTEILQLIQNISDKFDTFESNLNDLTLEVEDNELVAAKALTDLNNKVEEILNNSTGSYPQINHGTADTTFTLTPNTFHVWDEVASLTLDFSSETSGVANEFLFQFTSGATASSLTLPDNLRWANDVTPSIKENRTYQVSILEGLASVLEFAN